MTQQETEIVHTVIELAILKCGTAVLSSQDTLEAYQKIMKIKVSDVCDSIIEVLTKR